MKKISLLIALMLLLLNCATVSKKRIPQTVSEKVFDLSLPGVERKSAIGNTMIEIGKIKYVKEFVAVANRESAVGAPPGYTYPNVMSGDIFDCAYITDDNSYLCFKPGWRATLFGGKNATFISYLYIDNTGNLLGTAQGEMDYVYKLDSPINGLFKYNYNERPVLGSYKQELIYNGKSGNTIKITYREYVDSLARPAFFQNLEYDLSESKSIGFKDIKVKVIEATNSFIRFEVE